MKKQLIPIIITIFLVSAYAIWQGNPISPVSNLEAVPQADISFSKDVYPILESRCGKCHMGSFTSENLNMETYDSLMAGSQNGVVIIAGNAKESLLAGKILKGEMPKRGPKLTPAQMQIIIDWINAGAPNN
jgi:tRNA A37 threonylcarbamoyladenosine modification protein TsaB